MGKVVDLPRDIFIRVGSTVGCGCGSTAGEIHGMQVTQQLGGSGNASVGATTGSDNGEAGGAGSVKGLSSLAAKRTQNT
jgi:hypothetical protein